MLLAAGVGSRYLGAEPKLRAEVAGRSVLAWSVDAMISQTTVPCAIVVGADPFDDLLPPAIEVLRNPRFQDGMATSLGRAVEWATELGAEYLVVGLADQPGASSQGWEMVEKCGDVDFAFAQYQDRRGHPVRIANRAFSHLPSSGDVGARQLFGDTSFTMRGVAVPGIAHDLDTVEDRNWLTRVMVERGRV